MSEIIKNRILKVELVYYFVGLVGLLFCRAGRCEPVVAATKVEAFVTLEMHSL